MLARTCITHRLLFRKVPFPEPLHTSSHSVPCKHHRSVSSLTCGCAVTYFQTLRVALANARLLRAFRP